jgi:hypothetical protein
MKDIIRVLTNTVDASTWVENGGEGRVEPLGTALVVWQTRAVHDRIMQLLDGLREGTADRKTVTIDARWLMLTSDDLDSLVLPEQKGVPEVDRKRLAEFTRRAGSLRGITNCFSSQLVYLVSGTMRNIVSGYIPVVGSVEAPGNEAQLVGGRGESVIRLVADQTSGAPFSDRSV